MRLVYDKTGEEVKVGDIVPLTGARSNEKKVEVMYFREPYKPSSSGKVSVQFGDGSPFEYYVGVIGATWIEREDK